ncbi:Uncharacterized conserved protein, DUF1501 family [Enhydrobacter aerosaccus]|uniref:Uncharacterized conserved protein, DUF1501 family n=1 Tax=Enhydrobacter aerosaccus TaxID=225324 RepID=A0A1T4P2P9_9HYPH|nr:DUF1501 domain-containing protein [Enhydrobacter aerosaccus]SJZ85783.1 Uncharacterized conserved protein, DUF1501 family [Enhydrobacter aerosaccus]
MLTRRTLLYTATALSLAPSVRAFATPPVAASDNGPILITIFLRGGMDSLGVVAPVDDRNYVADRPPEMRLLADGDKPALELGGAPAGLDFRLHPEMAAMHDLYKDKRIALVHASGLANGTRSHFGAQELIERGISNPDEVAHVGGGWMARWLGAIGKAKAPVFSATPGLPDSLAGHADTICALDLKGGMNLPGGKQAANVLKRLIGADGGLYDRAARDTLAGISLIDGHLREPDGKVAPYQPSGGAVYEETEIGRSLQSVARVIRMDLGIRAFAVDMGGWDTHENQPPRLALLVGQLSRALAAFHTDLHDRLGGIVLVVMSEFGRRLRSNKSNGTDHGHAGVTIVSAPGIAGGRMHGRWPGLSSERLDNAVDLAMTTDIRSIVAELMAGPLRTPQAVAAAFPDFTPSKVGLV